MRKRLSAFMLVALLPVAACNPGDAFCDKYYECLEDEQDLDDDYVAVCQEANRSYDDVLRANEEDDCHAAVDAKNAWMACMAGLDCNDFEDEFSDPDECEDQYDDMQDAFEDAGNDCSVQTSPTGEQ